MNELRKPEDWLKHPDFAGYVVLDPDGWRGQDAPPWDRPIPYAEFERRLMECTVIINRA